MKNTTYYTSGQFAKMAHISVRTVRYYDKQNILKPSFLSDSGARFYSDEDFVKLQQILLLKYLGFALEDIKSMVVDDMDYQMFRNALNLQLKLVKDRIEQMQMVAQAISDTTEAIDMNRNIDWSRMMELIHLTNMENSLKSQYQNATNISARINLHKLYSTNQTGWFPWLYQQCNLMENQNVLEIGCGNGAIWKENFNNIPDNAHIVLSDISEGMLRDTKRELLAIENERKQGALHFDFHAFDCHKIPYEAESFHLVMANHVLFYCEDISRVLSEVKRVLKPDGMFVCSTYGTNHMKEITGLVQEFHSTITLSADKLYENFGLDNGEEILKEYFDSVEKKRYEDALIVDKAEPLIEYILSCHGNQNQYILDRYKDFRTYVEKKTKRGFSITKEAGIFICSNHKDLNNVR